MKQFWDNRYQEEGFAYGEKPNVYFAAALTRLPVGHLLLPAEGEGRNAIFAAKLGWQVHAIDQSVAGKAKALDWAKKENVTITYTVGDLSALDLGTAVYDTAALIFAHFPPALKTVIHHSVAQAVKRGGHILLEGFSKQHIRYNTENPQAGGPKDEEMLFAPEEMSSLFPGFETVHCEEKIIALHEGKYHVGQSAIVRYLGKKK